MLCNTDTKTITAWYFFQREMWKNDENSGNGKKLKAPSKKNKMNRTSPRETTCQQRNAMQLVLGRFLGPRPTPHGGQENVKKECEDVEEKEKERASSS